MNAQQVSQQLAKKTSYSLHDLFMAVRPLPLATLMFTSFFPQPAYSVDTKFNPLLPSCSGLFTDADCWANGLVPGVADNAFFQTNKWLPYRVSFDAPAINADTTIVNSHLQWDLNTFSYTMNDLVVGGNDGISPFLQITDGLVVSDSAVIGGDIDTIGSVKLDGPGTVWNITRSLDIGNAGSGNLAIQNGAIVTSHKGHVGGGPAGVGKVLVDGSGSEWDMAAELVVGQLGTGRVKIDNGAKVRNTAGLIGVGVGAEGAVTVAGAGSVWINSKAITVGVAGTGKLRVLDGASVTSEGLLIGNENGFGEVLVEGTGTTLINRGEELVINQGSLVIRDGATVDTNVDTFSQFNVVSIEASGSLTLESGSFFKGENVYIRGTSTLPGDPGAQVVVDGPGTFWDSSEQFHGNILVSGNRTMTVQNGAVVDNYSLTIGDSATAVVDGPGSEWINVGVHIDDSASLIIQNGGLMSGGGEIGGTSNVLATAIVTGAGSTWNNSALTLGRYGNADLKILDGATVSSVLAYMGRNPPIGFGGSGVVHIEGAQSSWDISDSLYIGGNEEQVGGIGMLTAGTGGVVSVANTLRVWDTSTLTLEDGGSIFTGGIVNSGLLQSASGGNDIHGNLNNELGGSIIVTGNSTLTLHGDVTHNGTEVRVDSGSQAIYLGAVGGLGDFTGTGTNIFEGSLLPGNSAGSMSFAGDVVLGDNNILGIEIGGLLAGTEFDFLDIDGTATLGGTLATDLFVPGSGVFVPNEGDTFDVLFAESFIGEFDVLNLDTHVNRIVWDVSYLTDVFGTQDVVRLSVVSVSAVPLPGAVWLFGSGLFFLAARVKRKRA